MAFVIGDYEYTVFSSTNRTVSAKVVDTTKTAYANIPQTVTNDGTEYTVTRLGSCFKNCANMVNPPSIPNTVTYMYSCFDGCSSMVGTPNIPNGVTGSMSYCFRNCASMVNPPNIPNGVTSIIQCFRGCSSMTAPPDLPASITSMGSSSDIHGCFEGCSSLAYAPSIPSGVKYLNYCFSRCTSLVNAPSIPDGVIDMYRTFHECNSLLEAPEIPNSVTDLGCCFWDTAITEPPEIPNSVTDMGYCFAFCENLERAPVIPNGVTDMGKCFTDCNSLTEPPVIPSSVTNIEGCFENCHSLLSAPAIPQGVTSMERCFCYCKSLKAPPAIPSGVENMKMCFYCCYSLESAPEIPQSVTSMEWCFVSCQKLASAPRLPANVADVERCFKKCYSLSGSIIVTNTPTAYDEIFTYTRNPIYVVPMGGADQTVWKSIADQYANVIFMADANSKPALAFTVTRVSASGATAEDVEGGWAHVVASATAYMDALPDGYTNDVGALTATLNGTAITPTWTQVSKTTEDYKVTLVRETWVQITDARQLFAIYVVDSYSARSAVITVKLPSTGVMWDVHAGGDGFTIGRRSTGEGFAVAMDSTFEGDVDVFGSVSVCEPVGDGAAMTLYNGSTPVFAAVVDMANDTFTSAAGNGDVRKAMPMQGVMLTSFNAGSTQLCRFNHTDGGIWTYTVGTYDVTDACVSEGTTYPTATLVIERESVETVTIGNGGSVSALGEVTAHDSGGNAHDLTAKMDAEYGGQAAYPLFISSSVPTGSSAYGLPACFVYCTADGGLYYCT